MSVVDELGLRLLGARHRLVGISNGPPPARLSATITAHLDAIGREHGLTMPREAPDVRGEYVGDGYGVPTPEGDRAIVLAARTEGIVLDPVYTGKALAAMADLIGRGELAGHETPLFIHTGGSPIVATEQQVRTAHALVHKAESIDASVTGTAGLAGLLAIRDHVSPDEHVAIVLSGVTR